MSLSDIEVDRLGNAILGKLFDLSIKQKLSIAAKAGVDVSDVPAVQRNAIVNPAIARAFAKLDGREKLRAMTMIANGIAARDAQQKQELTTLLAQHGYECRNGVFIPIESENRVQVVGEANANALPNSWSRPYFGICASSTPPCRHSYQHGKGIADEYVGWYSLNHMPGGGYPGARDQQLLAKCAMVYQPHTEERGYCTDCGVVLVFRANLPELGKCKCGRTYTEHDLTIRFCPQCGQSISIDKEVVEEHAKQTAIAKLLREVPRLQESGYLAQSVLVAENNEEPYLSDLESVSPSQATSKGGLPVQDSGKMEQAKVPAAEFDVFISHATEDKPYVEPLVKALEAAGITVWYDRITMEWGDDLRPEIDRGLANCRFGVVVFSKAFLAKKKWTEYELNALFAREKAGQKVILPIWHGVTRDDLLQYSPAFADRLAKISSGDSYADIVTSLLTLLSRSAKTENSDRAVAGQMPSGTAALQLRAVATFMRQRDGEIVELQLEGLLKNVGTTVVSEYHVDVLMPKLLLEGDSAMYWHELRERATDSHRFFRFPSKEAKPNPVYQDDEERLFTLPMYIDRARILNPDLLNSSVRLTCYAGEVRVSTSKAVSELLSGEATIERSISKLKA